MTTFDVILIFICGFFAGGFALFSIAWWLELRTKYSHELLVDRVEHVLFEYEGDNIRFDQLQTQLNMILNPKR